MSTQTDTQEGRVRWDTMGAWLRHLREDVLGLSLADMREELQALPEDRRPRYTSTNTISRCELDEQEPQLAYLRFLADRTGLPLEVVAREEVPDSPAPASDSERKLRAISALVGSQDSGDLAALRELALELASKGSVPVAHTDRPGTDCLPWILAAAEMPERLGDGRPLWSYRLALGLVAYAETHDLMTPVSRAGWESYRRAIARSEGVDWDSLEPVAVGSRLFGALLGAPARDAEEVLTEATFGKDIGRDD